MRTRSEGSTAFQSGKKRSADIETYVKTRIADIARFRYVAANDIPNAVASAIDYSKCQLDNRESYTYDGKDRLLARSSRSVPRTEVNTSG